MGIWQRVKSLKRALSDFGDELAGLIEDVAKTSYEGWKVLKSGKDTFVRWLDDGTEKVFQVVPTEVWDVAFGVPGAGLLVSRFGDEIIMMGPLGVGQFELLPPALQTAADLGLEFADLLDLVNKRQLNAEEWALAEWVFGKGNIGPRSGTYLTDLKPRSYGFDNPAMTVPLEGESNLINLGEYFSVSSTPDGGLLLHEMTHIWQIRRDVLREMSAINAIRANQDYDYAYGKNWSSYNLEEQAQIVEDWANGNVNRNRRSVFGGLSPVSPLFEYVQRNLRPFANDARAPQSFTSLRSRMQPVTSLSEYYRDRPNVWWQLN